MNKFYGIGVGIGDPELITLKGINALKKIDVLIAPNAGREFSSTAFEIVREYLKKEVEIVEVEFSMNPDISKRIEERRKNSDIIKKYLNKNKNVGFITIGDPMIYSTYTYLLENISKEYETVTIPGISSFSDIASRVNIPLTVGNETLNVLPLHKKITKETIEENIRLSDNIVIMKPSLKVKELKEAIINTNNENNIFLICEAGKIEEKIYFDLREIPDELPYFSTLIIKKGGLEKWK